MHLLHGPPETKSFRSGLVTLAPATSIGVHNSGTNEEMLVPLEGQASFASPTIRQCQLSWSHYLCPGALRAQRDQHRFGTLAIHLHNGESRIITPLAPIGALCDCAGSIALSTPDCRSRTTLLHPTARDAGLFATFQAIDRGQTTVCSKLLSGLGRPKLLVETLGNARREPWT